MGEKVRYFYSEGYSKEILKDRARLESLGLRLSELRSHPARHSDVLIFSQGHLPEQQNWPVCTIAIFKMKSTFSAHERKLLDGLKQHAKVFVINFFSDDEIALFAQLSWTTQVQSAQLEELKIKNIELEKKVKQAERAKNEFLANMSHEIRTPLGAVIGFSELLVDDALPAMDRIVCKSAIERNGKRLADFIADILDLAQVESGRLETHRKAFSVDALLNELIIFTRGQASKKRLSLNFEWIGERSRLIVSDSVRIKQIIYNLLQNAVKFTDSGSILVKARCQEDQLVVQVEDSGVGIDPDRIPSLFQAFGQLDSSTTRAFGGSGVGLALSRRLARALGGELMLVWSSPGIGSCFQLQVPVQALTKVATPDCTVRALNN